MPEPPSLTLPDLSARPFQATAEREMVAPPDVLLQSLDDRGFRSLVCCPKHIVDQARGQRVILFRGTF
jgi:hypothetical protein